MPRTPPSSAIRRTRACPTAITSRRVGPLATGLLLCLALALGWLSPCLAQPAPSAELRELKLMAGFAVLEENFAALAQIADKGLALDPDDADLIEAKLRAMRALGQEEQALQFIRGLWGRDAKRFAYLRFEAGYIRSRQKQLDKALIHFRHAEEVDKTRAINEQINTCLAMGDLEKALAGVGRLDPGAASTWLTKGQVLLLQKDYAGARAAFKSGLAAGPTPEETRTLNSRLPMVDQEERANRPWRLNLTALAQYEDNVFRDPLQNNPAAPITRSKGDWSFLTKLHLDYRLGRDGPASWGLASHVMTVQYAKLRDANYSSLGLGAYWEYQTPSWGIRLPYDFTHYWAKAALIRKVYLNSLSPWLRLQHLPWLRTDVHGLLESKTYRESEPNYLVWRLALVHYLSRDPSLRPHLRLGYALSQDIASDDKSGFTTGEVSLGGAMPLGKAFTLDLSAAYVRYWYESRVDPWVIQQGEVSRRDDQYRTAVQLIWRPGGDWSMVLGWFWASNDSGIMTPAGHEPYDFRRNAVSLMLNWAF